LQSGTLVIPGPRIAWWDADAGAACIAELPPLRLQVAPAAQAAVAGTPPAAMTPDAPDAPDAPDVVDERRQGPHGWAIGLLAALAVAAGIAAWWLQRARRRRAATATATPRVPDLAQALQAGALAEIAQALMAAAGPGADLATLQARLDDPAQVAAVQRLQAARWGADDAAAVLAPLRIAFARGPRWRRPARKSAGETLPPLYPE
jgi:hypothetical protein